MQSDSKQENSGSWFAPVLVLLYLLYMCWNKTVLEPKYVAEYFQEYYLVDGRFRSLRVSDVAANDITRVVYWAEGKQHIVEPNYIIPCRESYVKNPQSRKEILSHEFQVAVSKIAPEEAIPLLTPYDFDRLGLAFPDSLAAMYSKYFECTAWEIFWEND